MTTTQLRNGIEVLAKATKTGFVHPVTYANLTQAQRKVEKLGAGWKVVGIGRPFFVAKASA